MTEVEGTAENGKRVPVLLSDFVGIAGLVQMPNGGPLQLAYQPNTGGKRTSGGETIEVDGARYRVAKSARSGLATAMNVLDLEPLDS